MKIIRRAAISDIPEMLKIYSPYVTDTPVSFEYEVPSLENFTLRFKTITKQFPWLVCEWNGQIVGYAYAHTVFERAAYQWIADISVYIDAAYHRNGIATLFYQSIEQFLKLQGYYQLYAIITSGNQKSLRFHESLGFREMVVYQNCGYKLGSWHDVSWYIKELALPDGEPRLPIPFHSLDDSVISEILSKSIQK